MAEHFSFDVLKRSRITRARLGMIRTRQGYIETPQFIPVATVASVRALGSDDLRALGVQAIFANTYHLHLRTGEDLIRRMGGLHRFMSFDGPIFTDSGGFQAFSLGLGREHNISKIGSIFPQGRLSAERRENLTRITDEGVAFKSLIDGGWHFLDPRSAMRIQSRLGSDIIMAFDECTSPLSDYDYTREAMERTHRWALQSLRYHDRRQAIYGIIQGGWFEDLRRESADFIRSLPFDGIAIGGSLGNCKEDMHQVLDWVIPRLDERPRHLLGIGEIPDIFECVERGIDTFDCVHPTRIARRGNLYISPASGGCIENKFRISIKSSIFKDDKRPVDPRCGCPTCRMYSRAYLRHLYISKELSYFRAATVHNVFFMLQLMESIRRWIRDGRFSALKRRWMKSES
ncbi:MAG TPA: tRNA guanosine(34) transglycosylase Tgt [Methanothrix sp.]|nr:tRNA guanosine(34) transglycosylase Tgt [Methanothrix sp.]HOK58791.1 tRNA guanosine(34) transglycosylase Tgt [Methanothrix sp.]HOL43968.1 tRNA guanosine(34) transglycosylase Tgt [Methanothrix sp.]HPO89005.1 tRNA guanosine(34) transglycosylase Tgt [Methanothrix sp.]